MKVAIVGSRNLTVDLKKFLPENIKVIVSGGAIGIDTFAKNYALENNIQLVEFLPNYKLYGTKAPLIRNTQIVEYSDIIFAFWDGKSRGTLDTIKKTQLLNKKLFLYRLKHNDNKILE